MISLGNYFGVDPTPEETKALAAKAAAMFRPVARAIKEDPQKAKETIAPTIKDPELRAKFEAQLEPLIQEQKKEAGIISVPLTILSGVTVLSLVTFLLLRKRRKRQNPYGEQECGYCKRPTDSISGFCSIECERRYGSCPLCGAPSRGNRLCWDCRQENPFKRKKSSYVHPTFDEKVHSSTWQVEFETVTGSCGTKTYKSYSLAKRSMDELDKRDDIKWSSLRRV